MINDIDIEFQSDQGKGQALVWVIDGECLYDLPLNKNYASMFLATTDILDVSNEYPDLLSKPFRPPGTLSRSTTVTFLPAPARRSAALKPARPAPTTTTWSVGPLTFATKIKSFY